jgi:hypothetical protein
MTVEQSGDIIIIIIIIIIESYVLKVGVWRVWYAGLQSHV